jgi:uncharacterized protein YhdP
VRGQFLGDALAISGGTQHDGSTQVKLEGHQYRGAAQAIHRAFAAAPAGAHVWRHPLQRHGVGAPAPARLTIESGLVGLGVDLPVPLRKGAQDSLPLRMDLLPLASTDP